jgi:hypothetical protein
MILGTPDRGREYMVLVEDSCVEGPCANSAACLKVATVLECRPVVINLWHMCHYMGTVCDPKNRIV